jgi:hypothetical protein
LAEAKLSQGEQGKIGTFVGWKLREKRLEHLGGFGGFAQGQREFGNLQQGVALVIGWETGG